MIKTELKYGINPNQKPAFISFSENSLEVLNGKPGYINFMDALNAWQLVRELKQATDIPAAASFKHVSPAGVALGFSFDDLSAAATALTEERKIIYQAEDAELTPISTAYIKARGADRMSSYGDFVALSDVCDKATANFLKNLVSDGIIAPDYTEDALEILKSKRKGSYNIIKINPDYESSEVEIRTIFGAEFKQGVNNIKITDDDFKNIVTSNKNLPENAVRDLKMALITLKYTQSNSVCYVKDGETLGIGAGQQSRIHCTRLAGQKTDCRFLREHPKAISLIKSLRKKGLKPADIDNAVDVFVSEDNPSFGGEKNLDENKVELTFSREEKLEWLTKLKGVSLGSDAFFPFGDNIERAVRSGVSYIAQPGGSIRDDNVIDTCNKYNITMAFNGIRLFHH